MILSMKTNTFDLIMCLRKMEIGEERAIGKHKLKRMSKYKFNYVCSCCLGKSIAYGKH